MAIGNKVHEHRRNLLAVPSDFDRNPEQALRIRAALYGRGELTREDAELLSRQHSSAFGWFGRRSAARTVVLALLALLGAGLAVIRGINNGTGSAVGPIILAVAFAGALVLGHRRNRIIDRALRKSRPE